MSEKEFNIETRLCAYIDGLLDAEQRAQIEQYLDRYPEHRQLIDQLMQERSLLRDLPRKAAPADVLGHFQGQLERTVLLDDFSTGAAASRSSRRGRWNLAALAAILLFGAGLGVIVWIAMPPQRGWRSATSGLPDTTPKAPLITTEASTTEAVALQPAPPAPISRQQARATVVDAGDQIIVMILSDDLPAAQKQADVFLTRRGLSHVPATPQSTQPATTQTAATQSDGLIPAAPTTWLVPQMSAAEARELAGTFFATPATIPSTGPAAHIAATSQPITRPRPSTQAAGKVILIFQKIDFSPARAENTLP